jgi:hypothetical protein
MCEGPESTHSVACRLHRESFLQESCPGAVVLCTAPPEGPTVCINVCILPIIIACFAYLLTGEKQALTVGASRLQGQPSHILTTKLSDMCIVCGCPLQAPEHAWLSAVGVFDELHAPQKLSTPQVGGGGDQQ